VIYADTLKARKDYYGMLIRDLFKQEEKLMITVTNSVINDEIEREKEKVEKQGTPLRILCIFLPTGKTYTFKNVTIITDNETMLVFRYAAMSDGLQKTATFPKNTLCGWSVTP